MRREEKAESKRQQTLQRELEWIRMSPKGRHAKSQSRINSYEQLLGNAGLEKEQTLELFIPPGPRLGGVVVETQGVSKGFGDRLLIDNLSFTLPAGGIVGVIGPNGAGKSTLFNMITGQEQPDSGSFKVGETVQLGYVDQSRELDGNKTIWEEVTGGQDQILLGGQSVNSRAYVARFNFPAAISRKGWCLSGGERNRVHLAKCCAKKPTFCCSMSRPTTWTSTPCALWRKVWRTSVAVLSSSVTIAGSWIGSRPISWPSKEIPRWSGTKAIIPNMKRIASAASAKTPISRTGSGTAL